MTSPTLIAPLRNPVYRRLFSAQVIGLIGSGLTTVALGLLAFQLAGGNAGEVLGVVLALKVLTYVLVSPAAAVWSASVPRKQLLIAMDLIRALAIGSIVFVDAVWQIYLLIVIVSAASAVFTPAFQALIPDIFEDVDTYTAALSVHRIAYEIEAVFSPLLAGMMLAVVSYSALFAANSVAFLVSAALVLTTAIPVVRGRGKEERSIAQINRGVGRFLSIPRLRGLFALDWAVAAAGAMVIINTVVFVKGEFSLGASEVAWALAAFGLGSLTIASALPRVFRRVHDRSVMLIGGLILSVSMILTWLFVGSFWSLIGPWILAGAGTSMVLTSSGRLIQRSGDSSQRPTLFAAQFSLSHLCWLFTYPIAGFVGAGLGLSAAAAVLGGIAVIGTIAAFFLWREPASGRGPAETAG